MKRVRIKKRTGVILSVLIVMSLAGCSNDELGNYLNEKVSNEKSSETYRVTTEEEMMTQEEAGNPIDEPNQEIDEGVNIPTDFDNGEEDKDVAEAVEENDNEIFPSGDIVEDVISLGKKYGLYPWKNRKIEESPWTESVIDQTYNYDEDDANSGSIADDFFYFQIYIDLFPSEDEAYNAFNNNFNFINTLRLSSDGCVPFIDNETTAARYEQNKDGEKEYIQYEKLYKEYIITVYVRDKRYADDGMKLIDDLEKLLNK